MAGFLRAYNKGLKEVIANPDEGVRIVRQREPMIDAAIETRRLKGLIDVCIVSPTTKAQGLGELDMGRLDKQVDDVAAVFNLRSKPAASTIFNPAFLPPKQDRMLG